MERRKWKAPNGRGTSLRLEEAFFQRLETAAQRQGQTWRELVTALLEGKPPDRSRSSWLREKALNM